MKWEEPEVQKPETVIGDPTMDPDQFPSQTPLLTWTGSVDSYTPPSQPTEPSNGLITLRATNKTGRAIAFKRIKLSMIPTTNIGFPPTCLFIEDNLDEWKEWVNPETIIKDWEARRKARIDADREAAEAAKKAEDERKKAELDEERSKQQEKKEPVAGLEIPSADAPIKIIPDAEDSILTGKESNLSEKIQVPATATGENTGGVGDKFDSPKDPLVEKPDPEPLPPLPKATYLLKQHKVTAQGKMWVRLDGTDMVFEIMPMGSDGDINEGGKVILGRDAVLEIVLDGKVSLSGKYLLEIQEFWADPTDDDSRAFDEFPYAYVAVELNPSGNGTVKALDYNQAKEIQMKKE
ncbi:uncharacterized protein N7483_010727 [Penicillium malachiteum]|uniref:uncharacterized protein n=1 Tax=Penicillium malachiteum TaxID=1324776 RepID=UPI0025473A6B|nr:uncharacterized protein N7483_010727 [Penicillium malachiteum]KAJ5713546.1 hypothetical protein N7483_010727 [Penicillium malachiteum]